MNDGANQPRVGDTVQTLAHCNACKMTPFDFDLQQSFDISAFNPPLACLGAGTYPSGHWTEGWNTLWTGGHSVGWKLEYMEKTHVDMGRSCTFHTGRPQAGFRPCNDATLLFV